MGDDAANENNRLVYMYQNITKDLNTVNTKIMDYMDQARAPSRVLTENEVNEQYQERQKL